MGGTRVLRTFLGHQKLEITVTKNRINGFKGSRKNKISQFTGFKFRIFTGHEN